MADALQNESWREVLEFWFPERREPAIDAETHRAHWLWRMHGGADGEILARFSYITARAAAGGLDDWSRQPEGRLALIVVLDQFSRSVWRGTARAFAQDRAALELASAGLANGHYAALAEPWCKIAFGQPLGHCEGSDHLERLNLLFRLRTQIADEAPASLRSIYQAFAEQADAVRNVITTFGRHPHRNGILGRPSTPAEQAYIATGDYPHLQILRN